MGKLSLFVRNRVWDLTLFLHLCCLRLTGKKPDGAPGKLYLHLHRNGGVDNVALRKLFPDAVALVSVQWHQNAFMRWYIRGIPVTRAKDKEKKVLADNTDALDLCAMRLKKGKSLLIAPEGTSHLKPGHLHFYKSAAKIVEKALESLPTLQVIPLSPIYLEPWAWRSPAEVYAGPALVFRAGQSTEEIHQEMTKALGAITPMAPDEESLMERKQVAWELGQLTGKPFSEIFLETPEEKMENLEKAHGDFHRKLPEKMPHGVVSFLSLKLSFSSMLIFFLTLLYRLALFAVWPALVLSRHLRKKLADDNNVIAVWRGMIDLPLIFLWVVVLAIFLGLFFSFWWGILPFFLEFFALLLEPFRRKLISYNLALEHCGRKGLKDYGDQLLDMLEEGISEKEDARL